MESRRKILVVDDESQITRVLRHILNAHGYAVRSADDGWSALELFRDWHPDLVITDLNMPEMDGLELCEEIRKVSQVPIIVLSVKGDESTKVGALDAGADDYVTKPFGTEELLARVRATLRRAPEVESDRTRLEIGDFVADFELHSVSVRGNPVHLTPKEFQLLVFFLKNEGKVLTHRKILASVWDGNAVEQTEYLRVFVGNLRKKFERDPADPKYIVTEPWVGYRFNPEGAEKNLR
jgi:two-component system, OmpR family, KDP operon response regulator KdpE